MANRQIAASILMLYMWGGIMLKIAAVNKEFRTYFVISVDAAFGIKYVMLVFCGWAMLAASQDLILDSDRYTEVKLYKKVSSIPVVDAFVSKFMMMFGEFDTDNYSVNGQDWIVWFWFYLLLFYIQVVFLNVIIAVVGDIYDKALEEKNEINQIWSSYTMDITALF